MFARSTLLFVVGAGLIYVLIHLLGGDNSILRSVIYSSLVSFLALVILFLMFVFLLGDDRTSLHIAAQKGKDKIVMLLSSKGGRVNLKNRYGWTPLHEAAGFGRKGIVDILISKGADVNIQDDNGQTPLHWAAFSGHTDVVDLLISKGADVNIRNKEGVTPAGRANSKNHKEVVQLLLKSGGVF